VKRLIVAMLVTPALALACGGEGPEPQVVGGGGTGGDPGPFPPVFAGVSSVTWLDGQNQARVAWQPATDADTPAEEIRYTIFVWEDRGDETPRREIEFPGTVESCRPECRYNIPLIAGDVTWVAVEASDGEARVGRDVVRTVVAAPPDALPEIDSVTPGGGPLGTEVVIRGRNFFDEPMAANALTVGGRPVDPGFHLPGAEGSFLTKWSPLEIRFRVRAGLETGPLEIVTPIGAAAAPSDFVVE